MKSPPHEFDRDVLKSLEACFDTPELEVEIRCYRPGEIDAAVRVKHLPSGQSAESEKYETQIRNKIYCLLQLLPLKMQK